MAEEKNMHSGPVTILFSPGGKEKVLAAEGKFRGVGVGYCLASILQVCFAWYRARASGKSSEEAVREVLAWEAGQGRKAFPMPLVAREAKAPMLFSILQVWIDRLAPLEAKGQLKGRLGHVLLASEARWDDGLEKFLRIPRTLVDELKTWDWGSSTPEAVKFVGQYSPWNVVEDAWRRCVVVPVRYRGSWWWAVTGEDVLDIACAEIVLMIMHKASLHSRPRVCPQCYTVYWPRKRQGKWDASCPKCSPHATPEGKALAKFRARLRQAKRPRSKRGAILGEAGYTSLLRVARERGVAVAEKLYALVVEHGDIPGPGWDAVLSALRAGGIGEAEKRFMQFAGFSAPASNAENESIKAPCPQEREKQP